MLALPSAFKKLSLLTLAFAVASANAFTGVNHLESEYKLKSLREGYVERGTESRVTTSEATPMIVMLFQPDCPWCKKQSKTLAQLVEHCNGELAINLVGHKGSALDLRRELKHYPKSLNAYLSDKNFLRAIGGVKASPTTLFYNEAGQMISKQRGYIEPTKLLNAASIITGSACVL